LQQSIFARVTVNGNKGSVEADPLIIKDKGKVVFVNRKNPSFRIFPEPVSIPDCNNIGPVISLQGFDNTSALRTETGYSDEFLLQQWQWFS
jgi:hypothetical protein